MQRFIDHPYAKVIYGALLVLCFGLAWAMALRSIDSGSIFHYFVTFALIGIGIRTVVILISAFRR